MTNEFTDNVDRYYKLYLNAYARQHDGHVIKMRSDPNDLRESWAVSTGVNDARLDRAPKSKEQFDQALVSAVPDTAALSQPVGRWPSDKEVRARRCIRPKIPPRAPWVIARVSDQGQLVKVVNDKGATVVVSPAGFETVELEFKRSELEDVS